MKFWATVTLIVGAVLAVLKWIGPGKYEQPEPCRRRRRSWRIM